MKVCIPVKDQNQYQLCNDINNAPNIIIFDTVTKDYTIKDTSQMNLGTMVQFLIDNNVTRLISSVNVIHHHKYISCRDIIIYKPDKSANAFSNMDLFIANKLKIDKKNH